MVVVRFASMRQRKSRRAPVSWIGWMSWLNPKFHIFIEHSHDWRQSPRSFWEDAILNRVFWDVHLICTLQPLYPFPKPSPYNSSASLSPDLNSSNSSSKSLILAFSSLHSASSVVKQTIILLFGHSMSHVDDLSSIMLSTFRPMVMDVSAFAWPTHRDEKCEVPTQ